MTHLMTHFYELHGFIFLPLELVYLEFGLSFPGKWKLIRKLLPISWRWRSVPLLRDEESFQTPRLLLLRQADVLKCLFSSENTQNKYDRFHQTGLKTERRWMWNTDGDLFDLNVDFLNVWVLLCRVCQCCSVETWAISCDNNVTPSHLKIHVK